jgi:predicted RNase H-like HicB family nuclease
MTPLKRLLFRCADVSAKFACDRPREKATAHSNPAMDEPAFDDQTRFRQCLLPGKDMGQLVEWPGVVTEGRDIEECRNMLRDALKEMVLAYRQLGKEMPLGNALLEQVPVEVGHVSQAH